MEVGLVRSSPIIEKYRSLLRDSHIESSYYGCAESSEWLGEFWRESGTFKPLFDQLNLTSVVELACGHGRHSAQVVDRVGSLTLVDINRSNIEFCIDRFSAYRNIRFVINNGTDLIDLDDGQYTSLFCYDSMVHFEAFDTISYVMEISRILVSGGRALLHYSVNESNPEESFDSDPAWRNFFSEPLMRHAASRANFGVLERKIFDWPVGSANSKTDGLILLEKR